MGGTFIVPSSSVRSLYIWFTRGRSSRYLIYIGNCEVGPRFSWGTNGRSGVEKPQQKVTYQKGGGRNFLGIDNDPNLIPDELRNVWIQTVLSRTQMNLRKAGVKKK